MINPTSMKLANCLCWFIVAPVLLLSTGCNEPSTPNSTGPSEPVEVKENGEEKASTSRVEDQSSSANQTVAPAAPLAKKYTETIPPTLVEFDMVLVDGDEGAELKPFYIGKTEVTWDEYIYWALCQDLKEKKAILEREKKLRPSAPHDTESIYRGWGRDKQPAVGVSRLSAERYCDWLSEQTGKTYRLPTAKEWEHAFVAGGGQLEEPLSEDDANKVAWNANNSLDDETFDNRAMAVASLAPNGLGIHDMLGNVAEWVTGTGEEKIVRGGSFLTPPGQLSGSLKEAEDQSVWNKNYPNTPKSLWWYVDADYVGFRVVCEP